MYIHKASLSLWHGMSLLLRTHTVNKITWKSEPIVLFRAPEIFQRVWLPCDSYDFFVTSLCWSWLRCNSIKLAVLTVGCAAHHAILVWTNIFSSSPNWAGLRGKKLGIHTCTLDHGHQIRNFSYAAFSMQRKKGEPTMWMSSKETHNGFWPQSLLPIWCLQAKVLLVHVYTWDNGMLCIHVLISDAGYVLY